MRFLKSHPAQWFAQQKLAAVALLCSLIVSCVANQPAIRAADPDMVGSQNSDLATSAPVVAVHAGLATPTPIVTVSEVDGMDSVYVHAGSFTMGSRSDPFGSGVERNPDELPRHEVYLDAFWIDRTEVTIRTYARCVEAGACEPPAEGRSFTRDRYYDDPAYADHPVIYVSWHQAVEYCQWAERRLPTEAEWEKAARGTDERIYPWGDLDPGGNRMNYCDVNCSAGFSPLFREDPANDGHEDSARVGSYLQGASPYGARNMAGNVGEWVADWYGEDYYGRSPSDNPLGPLSGGLRVTRGGSWLDGIEDARTSRRRPRVPSQTSDAIGFRCATEASSEPDRVGPRDAR